MCLYQRGRDGMCVCELCCCVGEWCHVLCTLLLNVELSRSNPPSVEVSIILHFVRKHTHTDTRTHTGLIIHVAILIYLFIIKNVGLSFLL